MDGWFCVCVWVRVLACIHTYMYTSMRECLSMCYLRLCLYVWIYECMCVYISYLYISMYSGAVFHGSGTFILRSTDGYLATHFVFNICTGVLDRVSCSIWTGNSAYHTAAVCPPKVYTRRCCHISQSASSHATEKLNYKCWCFERHSTLPYDNMAM